MDKQTSETWDDKVREMLNARRGIVAPPPNRLPRLLAFLGRRRAGVATPEPVSEPTPEKKKQYPFIGLPVK